MRSKLDAKSFSHLQNLTSAAAAVTGSRRLPDFALCHPAAFLLMSNGTFIASGC
jgi:hypothetical protein